MDEQCLVWQPSNILALRDMQCVTSLLGIVSVTAVSGGARVYLTPYVPTHKLHHDLIQVQLLSDLVLVIVKLVVSRVSSKTWATF
jgi:hypothetical protein